MAFFLIGRGPEDDLRLLSDEFFATRQDAMAKLSSLSSDPSFSQWDTEVFVMDLEAGVPVLLVRPQGSQAPVAVAPTAEDTGDAAAWEADLPVEAVEAEELGAVAEAPSAEEAAVTTEEPAAEEPVLAQVEAVVDEASETEAAVSSDFESDELRDAILRTTEQMTAEGIVPPESAGLSAEEAPLEATAEEPELAAEEAAAETETEEPLQGEPATAVLGETEGEPGVLAGETEGASVWPWAAPAEGRLEEEPAISPDIANVYEALAEPQEAIADIAAAGSDETGDAMVEPFGSPHEPMSASEEEFANPAEEGSDFILDLDAIQPVALEDTESSEAGVLEQPVEVESAEPAQIPGEETYSSLTDYTCADCVYVETCPNRDQRAPKDCGSFQWK